jgi:CubicO group peptidase (beta-lactamase class C family)
MNSTISDHDLRQAIAQHVKGLTIDPARVRAHVIHPPHLDGVFSDRGPTGSTFRFPIIHPPVPPLVYGLDVAVLTAGLSDALNSSVAGYSFEIRYQGTALSAMNWRSAKDAHDGTEAWTAGVQFHVASVSKLITAMAMSHLMSVKGISPDAQIIGYLPDYWVKGPNIQYITFRNLFNHTSGLTSPDVSDFGVMKQAIEAGISLDLGADPHLGHYSYQAINYTLCRILLAVLNGNISASTNLPLLGDLLWDVTTISAYENYVQNNVFALANVQGATLGHPSAAGLAYRGPMDNTAGWNSGDLSVLSGAAGWHLTVNDVLNVMSAFRRGRSILSPEAAQAMLDNGFGIDPLIYPVVDGQPFPAGELTVAGEMYCKNGRWYDSTAQNRREEQALAYFLPNDMELVIFANSPFPGTDITVPTFRDAVTPIILNSFKPIPPTNEA